mmetsp:Transcript_19060/g.26901  ORF Transcript_19060/g.26901 Transcript_19060/m.26901 type:complete len:509 (+) Transcript_19060:101-1627(+)
MVFTQHQSLFVSREQLLVLLLVILVAPRTGTHLSVLPVCSGFVPLGDSVSPEKQQCSSCPTQQPHLEINNNLFPISTRRIFHFGMKQHDDDDVATTFHDEKASSTATRTYETMFVTHQHEQLALSNQEGDRGSKRAGFGKIWKRTKVPKRSDVYRFTYDFDELVIGGSSSSSTENTTAVMLIHPIGVGIGKWYHDRLLQSLKTQYSSSSKQRCVFLSPDLLGSATASAPIGEDGDELLKLPLLNITDWSNQLVGLMADYEVKSGKDGYTIGNWTVVANGGCSPVALKVAQLAVQDKAPFQAKLTNVVISSAPRLPFFLGSTDANKVKKSYRTLSGITGRLFWWYALRRDGKFIQKFSEKNLVGNPDTLGDHWTPNCVNAATMHEGRSRYSTFAFLAGTLQDGCRQSLDALKGTDVRIDFIRGTDKRRNRAKSWFWQNRRKKKGASERSKSEKSTNQTNESIVAEETIQDYVKKNGNRGDVEDIGGRISLAWEDSNGYADALMKYVGPE